MCFLPLLESIFGQRETGRGAILGNWDWDLEKGSRSFGASAASSREADGLNSPGHHKNNLIQPENVEVPNGPRPGLAGLPGGARGQNNDNQDGRSLRPRSRHDSGVCLPRTRLTPNEMDQPSDPAVLSQTFHGDNPGAEPYYNGPTTASTDSVAGATEHALGIEAGVSTGLSEVQQQVPDPVMRGHDRGFGLLDLDNGVLRPMSTLTADFDAPFPALRDDKPSAECLKVEDRGSSDGASVQSLSDASTGADRRAGGSPASSIEPDIDTMSNPGYRALTAWDEAPLNKYYDFDQHDCRIQSEPQHRRSVYSKYHASVGLSNKVDTYHSVKKAVDHSQGLRPVTSHNFCGSPWSDSRYQHEAEAGSSPLSFDSESADGPNIRVAGGGDDDDDNPSPRLRKRCERRCVCDLCLSFANGDDAAVPDDGLADSEDSLSAKHASNSHSIRDIEQRQAPDQSVPYTARTTPSPPPRGQAPWVDRQSWPDELVTEMEDDMRRLRQPISFSAAPWFGRQGWRKRSVGRFEAGLEAQRAAARGKFRRLPNTCRRECGDGCTGPGSDGSDDGNGEAGAAASCANQ